MHPTLQQEEADQDQAAHHHSTPPRIKRQLSSSALTAQDKLLYWAVFTLAFYGFLRASNGDLLTWSSISTMTKDLLRAAGTDPKPYSSHSYRIGAATAAAKARLPDHLIKTLGRWCSTAYQTYIRGAMQGSQTNHPGPVRYAS